MGIKCFLLGHKSAVQKDDKTTICRRCGYKQFWKKGYAEIGLSFTRRSNGLLGFLSEPTNWIPFIVIAIAIMILKEGFA